MGRYPRVMPRIADSLVIVFTPGVSLHAWWACGLLSREWPLIAGMSRWFGRVILVTHGGPSDATVLEEFLSGELASQHPASGPVLVVSREEDELLASWESRVPGLLSEMVSGDDGVALRTHQHAGGPLALSIRDALRARGLEAGVVARGGYLWSRMAAHEQSPDAEEAIVAAQVEARVCTEADVVLGTTAKMVDDLSWRYQVPTARARVVPPFVHAGADPTPASERMTEGVTILSVGALITRKRQDILIHAVALLPEEQRERVTLRLLGDGPLRHDLERDAREQGVRLEVQPPGAYEVLLGRLNSCTIYAQASAMEANARTLLQAMATGAAVVVADTPGLSSVVDHGLTGLKVPPTPHGFAHALGGLLDDEAWRDALGTAAASAARGKHALHAVVQAEIDAAAFALKRAVPDEDDGDANTGDAHTSDKVGGAEETGDGGTDARLAA